MSIDSLSGAMLDGGGGAAGAASAMQVRAGAVLRHAPMCAGAGEGERGRMLGGEMQLSL